MLSTESLIESLLQWRRDKLALTVLVGLMGGDSVTEAWSRLDDVLPTMRDLADGSQRVRGKTRRFDVDHDIAQRVYDLAQDVEPWLRQLAEREETR